MAFNKYQVIKGAVNYELANFIFNYFLLKRDAVEFMYKNNITYDNGMFGTWTDQQVPNTYSLLQIVTGKQLNIKLANS